MRSLVLTAILILPVSVSAQSSVGPTESPVSLYGVVPPDASGVQGAPASDLTGPAAGDATDAKRGEFLIAPLPMVNPTLENGLAFAIGPLSGRRHRYHDGAVGVGHRRFQDEQRKLGGNGIPESAARA